ncbi:MAG: cellulase N-terminal Ig-like domain-containing protein, partial [Clostridiaceae bacterium]
MKRVFAFFLAVSLVFLVACKGETTNVKGSQENLIKNGDFSSGMINDWALYEENGSGEIGVVDEELEVKVKNAGSLNYSVQVYQDGFTLEKGCKYELKFDARSTIDRSFECRIQLNGGDYRAYASLNCDSSDEMKSYSVEFDMKDDTDPAPRLALNLGTPKDSEKLEYNRVYFDNFSLILLDDSNKVEASDDDKTKSININQLGYYPDYEKVAVFRGDKVDKTFDVVNTETDKVVYTGKIKNEFKNETAGETNYYGDFSEVTKEGTYIIKTKKLGESYSFRISKDVYDSAYVDTIRMLFLQRCGSALTADMAGDYAHPICHENQAIIYGQDKKIDVSGGWHDAGDYGRYVVPGAKTVADLFLSYQSNPGNFGD